MAVAERVSARDLYPSARELFDPPRGPGMRRAVRPALAWLLAGAIVALAVRRLLAWLDRNI